MKLLKFILNTFLVIGFIGYVIIFPISGRLRENLDIALYAFSVLIGTIFSYEILKKEILPFIKKT
ncbi:hypothetical protein UF75_5185 [Desulfosporosinus sp. I2]|uniref:hypothetical protein n=1 Tax=Desulfosporosinus sp. I2 TaxID=1617025 RepID=UPI0005F05F89|nr:hypothetical protein [Desulfosporosinus sp. I2]KJR44436.1 hypothetical protein UF75_5185 [Desulfosporosinus sp. I2]